jgi:hypothetical protein
MQIQDIFGQIRPLTSLVGSVLIIVGLIDYAGIGNIPGDGLYTAVAGFLTKNI